LRSTNDSSMRSIAAMSHVPRRRGVGGVLIV
jgi:hypothetical protein